MKIALITARRDPFISPYDMDGGCVVVRNYIKELHKLEHDISVYTRLEQEHPYNSEKLNTKAKMQKEAGTGKVKVKNRLTIYRIPYTPEQGSDIDEKLQLVEAESFSKNLRQHFEHENYDIYHYFHLLSISGWYKTSNVIPHLAKSVFTPLLITKGRSFEYNITERLDLEKRVFEEIPNIVSQSSGELKQLLDFYPSTKGKVTMIPLGVDEDMFFPKESFQDLKKESLIIVSPNTIKPQKQQLDALKVLAKLKKDKTNIKLLLIGNIKDKEYFRKIENEIASKKMTYSLINEFSKKKIIEGDKDIYILPGQTEPKLAKILRASDISLFPSKDEGFGLLVLDCMSIGTFPVCYKLESFCDYIIPGENALTAEVAEGWEGLTKQLLRLLNDRELLVKLAKTSTNISRNFSWSNLIKTQLQVYNNILDGNASKYVSTTNLKNWVNLHETK